MTEADDRNANLPTTPVDVTSELARERRESARDIVVQTPPEFVIEIMQSEVSYTIRPSMIPLNQVSFKALQEFLQQAYGVSLFKPDPGPLLKEGVITPEQLASLSMEDVAERLLRTSRVQLIFHTGRFPTSKLTLYPFVQSFLQERT